ncbi:MAG TPA: energy transducer TonB [Patescibacteria group bacterium]|nr:energy transducer TonB [Patescibacteria group bacterium]
MFDMFLPGNETRKKNVRKGLTFSLSLFLHALLLAAIIVVPLLRAEARLPEFKFIDVLIAPPILPGVPPGPGRVGRPPAGPTDTPGGPKNPPTTSTARGFMAPVDIPTTIGEEDPTAWIPEETSGPGITGGAGDGKSPWIMGEGFKPDEIIAHAAPLVTVRAPRLIKRVNPEYPHLAIITRVSGVVVVEASTDIYGRVKEARIISGHSMLHQAALEAVHEWIYEPYYVNAIPRPVKFTVTITFTLENR